MYKNDLYRFILNSDENASLTHKDAQNTFMASTFGKRRKTQVFLILTVPLANKKVLPSKGPKTAIVSSRIPEFDLFVRSVEYAYGKKYHALGSGIQVEN